MNNELYVERQGLRDALLHARLFGSRDEETECRIALELWCARWEDEIYPEEAAA